MTRRLRPAAIVVAALAMLGALGGCGDDGPTEAPSQQACLAPSETGGGGSPATTECRDTETVPADTTAPPGSTDY